jgi:pimeloyl-ACP methyl ester carboxylesterase
MRNQLQIKVLGELKVARDGKALPLPASKKTRALLGYLAVVGRPVRRDHLCEMFWKVPDDPRASLRWSLHKIRRITNADGQECLVADNDRAFLDPHIIDLDFLRVCQLRSSAVAMLDTVALEELAGMFAGQFLDDLRLPHCPKFEAWRLYNVGALTRIRVGILRALVERTRGQPERNSLHLYSLQSLGEDVDVVPREIREGPAEICGIDRNDDVRRATSALPGARGQAGPAAITAREGKLQDIRFCRSRDGVQIAYATCGHGPLLVRAAHWMSHLRYDWESPVWRHWIEALSESATLIRYDQRGNGLSDREVSDFAFEAMVDDLQSVVEATQLPRFTLLGVSQSCAVSVAYAARHPERLTGLILYGGFVQGWRARRDRHEIATHEAMTNLMREGWGMDNPAFRQLFTIMFIPDADQEQIRSFNKLQRISVSADQASRLHRAFGDIDVSAILAGIATPTLVLHARHDAVVPFNAGREFATGIRGARFVELDSANHILRADEPAFSRFCGEVTRFISQTAC